MPTETRTGTGPDSTARVVSTEAFKRRLNRLSQQEFRDFVAEIWRTDDEIVDTEGSVVTIAPSTGKPIRIRVVCNPGSIPVPFGTTVSPAELETIDVLVTDTDSSRLREIADDTDTRYVGPDRLRLRALYAVDRDRCKAIFREFFDRPVEELPCRGEPTERIQWFVGTLRSERQLSDPLLPRGDFTVSSMEHSVVFVVLVTVAFVTTGVGTSTGFAVLSLGHELPSTTDKPPSAPLIYDMPDYPPGISPAGITNRSILVAHHEPAISDNGERLTVRQQNINGNLLTTRRIHRAQQIVSVTDDGYVEYTANGSVSPATIGGSPRPLAVTASADEQNCTTRRSNDSVVDYDREGVCRMLTADQSGAIGARITGRYLSRYLSTSGGTVNRRKCDGSTYYWVNVSEPPKRFPEVVSNYEATGLVDSSGVVVNFTVTYERLGDAASEPTKLSFKITEGTGNENDCDFLQ